MATKKTTKNVEPKNPETKAADTDTDRTADRKSASFRFGSRKSARKTNAFKYGG